MGGMLTSPEKTRSKAVRAPYLLLGMLCVALGYIGIVVPGMPSTVFFICAVWSFKRSSPRFEHWMLNHRVFGPTLRDWDEHRAISVRTKIVAIVTMSAFMSVSIFFIKSTPGKLAVGVVCVLVAIYIATRKTKEATA